jgi:hypothetical protein
MRAKEDMIIENRDYILQNAYTISRKTKRTRCNSNLEAKSSGGRSYGNLAYG